MEKNTTKNIILLVVITILILSGKETKKEAVEELISSNLYYDSTFVVYPPSILGESIIAPINFDLTHIKLFGGVNGPSFPLTSNLLVKIRTSIDGPDLSTGRILNSQLPQYEEGLISIPMAPLNMVKSTTYFMIVEPEGGTFTDYITIGRDKTNKYPNGIYYFNLDGTWKSLSGIDLYFEVWGFLEGTEPVPYTTFLTAKSSYINGGSYPTFITTSNSWVS